MVVGSNYCSFTQREDKKELNNKIENDVIIITAMTIKERQ